MAHEYIHPFPDEETRAIGGGYTTSKEERTVVGERDVLYSVVVAVLDSSCCGAGGSAYLAVAGHVLVFHSHQREDGRLVSLVEPITDRATQRELARALRNREHLSEVRFWEPPDRWIASPAEDTAQDRQLRLTRSQHKESKP